MTKQKIYKYIGYNGIITSPILLPDISHQVFYELRAAGGKILTDGEKQLYVVIVPEQEVEAWNEIDGYDYII